MTIWQQLIIFQAWNDGIIDNIMTQAYLSLA